MQNIRIVLVRTSHPGNIGAAARAMKNMGLSKLYLVEPKVFPHAEATARASGASDILDNAKVVNTFADAIEDCQLMFGTSARLREMSRTLIDVREAAQKIHAVDENQEIAIIFGHERTGLTNDELKYCHYHIKIPTEDNFASLNLAAAVQVVAYELYMAFRKGKFGIKIGNRAELPNSKELEGLYQHVEEVMIKIEFLNPKKPRKMMPRIRQIISRAQIDKNDLDLLRGMMSAIEGFENEADLS